MKNYPDKKLEFISIDSKQDNARGYLIEDVWNI